jgi:diaminopimelate decarboxylase
MNLPYFQYSRGALQARAEEVVTAAEQLPFGHVIRYAVKANPHPDIINIFASAGLHFDASSSYEAQTLLDMGIAGERISLSSQQPAHNLDQLLEVNVQYVATSLHQLELYCQSTVRPGTVGLRVNPGVGSGHNNRTTTGGINSSFGLWHEYLEEAHSLAERHGVNINRLHVHIGSGADPSIWKYKEI